MRSVAVDAIDADAGPARGPAAPLTALAKQFLAVAAAAPRHGTQALGLGEDVRLTSPSLAGAALVSGHVVHLGAFAQ